MILSRIIIKKTSDGKTKKISKNEKKLQHLFWSGLTNNQVQVRHLDQE
jgi:hypothetical protein